MKQFYKNHKVLSFLAVALVVVILFITAHFLKDKQRHERVLHDAQTVVSTLETTTDYAEYMSGIETKASRSCGRGQGKYGPGALQCNTNIKLEGEVFNAGQMEYLLRSTADTLNQNGFLFDQNNLKDMIPDEETEYLSEVVSFVHDHTRVECGVWYEYLNDEERNETRLHPVELPYITIHIGCDDIARLERLLDREILSTP